MLARRAQDYWLSIDRFVNWSDTASGKNDFYTDYKIKQMYKAHLRTFTSRVNTINGRKYSEDPTIYYWNLLNEPRWCAPVPHPISTLQYREPLRAGSGVLAVPGNNALPQSGMRSHRAAWACGRTLGRGCPLHMLFALRLEALQSKSACCLSVWNLAPAVVVVIC